MKRLMDYPLDDPPRVHAARDFDGPMAEAALGISLAEAGCSYEAAHLLRPTRKVWRDDPEAATAKAALDAQTWWNKNWREFAQLMQAGRRDDALSLLGDRAVQYWDLPPLLMHLAALATDLGSYELGAHIYRRISGLAARGLPKMPMKAFSYASAAGLVEVMSLSGEPDAALEAYHRLMPNPGNAMAHQLQGARLMVAAGQTDAALRQAAEIAQTALAERKGYSREVRLNFLDNAAELAPLRELSVWQKVREAPADFLAQA